MSCQYPKSIFGGSPNKGDSLDTAVHAVHARNLHRVVPSMAEKPRSNKTYEVLAIPFAFDAYCATRMQL